MDELKVISQVGDPKDHRNLRYARFMAYADKYAIQRLQTQYKRAVELFTSSRANAGCILVK